MSASARTIRFGFGPWSTGAGDSADVFRYAVQADRAGLDLFTLSEHPNVGGRFDAHAVLGSTSHLTGAVNVTNLPSRPTPMPARSIGARRDGPGPDPPTARRAKGGRHGLAAHQPRFVRGGATGRPCDGDEGRPRRRGGSRPPAPRDPAAPVHPATARCRAHGAAACPGPRRASGDGRAHRPSGRRWNAADRSAGTVRLVRRTGDAVSEPDVQLWPTLARFDLVYNPVGASAAVASGPSRTCGRTHATCTACPPSGTPPTSAPTA